jgi:hypothetical protein
MHRLPGNASCANRSMRLHHRIELPHEDLIIFCRYSFFHPPGQVYASFRISVKLFLLKNVRFARYRRFWVLGFDGHFDLFTVIFRYLETTYPPILKCSDSDGGKIS